MFKSPYSRQELILASQARQLPALRSTDSLGGDAVAVVKLFNPAGAQSWFITELDPETGEAFGLCVGAGTELGYIDLTELADLRLRFGLGIERDTSFLPTKLRALRDIGEHVPDCAAWQIITDEQSVTA